ncbi:hypothetical protein BU23DRAFT_571041 [Bimuria novae-zelandiae CBS 107.79]|uniref:AB hydrolase-1 domain-containing protein n=1 Tax=Bimuria novae-zelandiae CBS 107.79 TaxID=1447943 RepID=A0A6A5V1R1_9PLEO|nr:hypothetical protein BU23DRAFT_571041 [Bimuria novae-zelandiae CBS 107.79]
MIGTSIPAYLFIRTCIFALRLITPLSIFFCSLSIAEPPQSGFTRFLLVWAILETAFWLLVFLPRKRALQAEASHPSPLDREERKALFWKCWEWIPEPEAYVSRWFLGARSWEVRRENVREFFRWALLYKSAEDVQQEARRGESGGIEREGEAIEVDEEVTRKAEEERELEEYVDGVQTMLGRQLLPGKGPAKSLRLTVDEVKMLHRPFLWYLIVFLVDTLTAAYLRYNGFLLYRTHVKSALSMFPPRIASLCTKQISSAPDISYWYRQHTSKTRLPILFIHGIGIGLFPYSRFFTEINKHDPRSAEDGEIGIIAIELMPISFRISGPMLDRDEVCRQINLILERHGFDKVVLGSHSYGSVITTHLLQNPTTASKIGPMLFVDPVTFLLHLPDVAYNFTARKPRRANEHQLHYFASTDMMVAHSLGRNFFWPQNILWKDELRGRDVTVSLGARDLIVDTETVGKYLAGVDLKSEDGSWKEKELTGHGLETLWWATCDHAQVFERRDGRAKLADALRRYVEQSGHDDDEEWP